MHIISFGDFAVASSFAFTIFSGIWDITNALTKVKSTKALREQTAELRKAKGISKKTDAYGVAVSGLQSRKGKKFYWLVTQVQVNLLCLGCC